MLKVDCIIVGQGVAGSCLALKLLKEKKSFIIIDKNKNKASSVAVGIFNPVVLYRFALIWNAREQLEWMHKYFESFEKLLNQKFLEYLPTYRILKNPEEEITWMKKAKKPKLQEFILKEIHTDKIEGMNIPFGYAEVLQTGRINLENLLESFRNYLIDNNLIKTESFDFSKLEIKEEGVEYKGIQADKIIFCEGYGVLNNPFFDYLPIIGVKGEVLKIKLSKAIPKAIWKSRSFLLPLENGEALTASTYEREDLSYEPTEKGKKEIQKSLEEFYSEPYEILDHIAGIRPTVIDRRPILGNHHQHKSLYILNGMGTRGTLLAPQMTEFLYDFMMNGKEITREADIRRFDKLL